MSTRKKATPLEPAALLGRMTPGKIYKAYEIAERMARPTDIIRALLVDMVAQGQLELVKQRERAIGYRRPRKHNLHVLEEHSAPSEPEEDARIIAARRSREPPSGTLTGYDEELKLRAELAMLSRKR